MPITYNGIGTRYHGTRNAIAREGHCASCKRLATLSSYETTLFFVVLFIPIIPLGKKRIVDQCSKCRRHYVVPLKTYLESRARDYAEAERLMASAAVEGEAIAALRLVNSYREVTTIDRFLQTAETKFPDSPTLHLFIAESRRSLSEYRAAEASTARSLALREDPAVRENLAIFQFARGDVDAGRATLAPLLDAPTVHPAAGVAVGVEALQALGRHREALELMNRVPMDGAPADVAKRFAKLRATSEQTLERSLVEPEKFEIAGDGNVVRRKRLRFAKLKWAAAAVAVVAAGYAGYAFFLGVSRRAFLVNGTERPYTATVDGHAYALQPHEVRPIRVGEGDVAMSIAAPGYLGRPSTFRFATGWLKRPFDGDVLVLNPDGVAAIYTGEAIYTSGGGGSRPQDVLHTASVGHVLAGVAYAFAEPPKSVTLSSETDTIRYGVAYLEKVPMSRLLEHLNETKDGRARAVATNVLDWPVLDADEAQDAIEALGPDEAIASLKPRVAQRPIELEAHRSLQDLRAARGESATLTKEYQAMLDADPANGTLMYLVGRTLDDDPDAALALYRRALDARPPEPMASVGESYVLASRAQFDDALVAIRAARAAMPTRDAARESEWELLIATHRYAEAMQTLAGQPETEATTDFRRRLETLFAAGKGDDGEALLARRKETLTKRFNADDASLDDRVNRGVVAYLRHQESTFADLWSIDAIPGFHFAAAISKRDLPTAEKLLAAEPTVGESSAMMMFLAADASGQADVAKRWLGRSIDACRAGRAPLPTVAAWLAGERTPTEADLMRWTATPSEKAIACAAIAAARPSLAPTCGPIAERFSFDPFYPHELIAASLAKHR